MPRAQDNPFGFSLRPRRESVTLSDIRHMQEAEADNLACKHRDYTRAKRVLKQRPAAYARAHGLRLSESASSRAPRSKLSAARGGGRPEDRLAQAQREVEAAEKSGDRGRYQAALKRYDAIETEVAKMKRKKNPSKVGHYSSDFGVVVERKLTIQELANGYVERIEGPNGEVRLYSESGLFRISGSKPDVYQFFKTATAARTFARKILTSKENPSRRDYFISGAIKRPGALHRKLGVPEGEDIPVRLLQEAIAHPERFERTRAAQMRLKKEAVLARTLKGLPRHYGPHKENPSERRNPEATLSSASDLYDDFHGEPPHRIGEYEVDTSIPPNLAELGLLLKIKIIGRGRILQRLAWAPEEGVKLAASPGKNQSLYIIGERQRLPENLMQEIGREWGDVVLKDVFPLGTIKEITYRAKKGFDKFEDIDYYHELGEETGDRPLLLYDRRNHRLLIAGGAYKVKPEGIVN